MGTWDEGNSVAKPSGRVKSERERLESRSVTFRETVASRLESAIRSDIIFGVLHPGQRLRTKDLSDRYGVSATPLREALMRLSEQGLVALDPRMGARIPPISIDDARDIYGARLIIEPRIIERSTREGDDAWLHRVATAMEELRAASASSTPDDRPGVVRDSVAWSSAHREFHMELLAGCESYWLRYFAGILYAHSERYCNLARGDEADPRSHLAEHERLFQAALARDPEGAAAALEAHLSTSLEVLATILKRQPPQ